MTSAAVINLSDDISPMSSSPQKEWFEQNSDGMLMPSDYLHAKEECTLSDPEDKEIGRNLFKECPDVPNNHKMISFPYRGQAWHPNFEASR